MNGRSASDTIQLINDGYGLAKRMGEDWDFLLNQLVDTNLHRPTDLTGRGKDGIRYNPRTHEVYKKDPSLKPKHYTHTKKTDVTLLPPKTETQNAGRICLFNTASGIGIGLLFDARQCDLKKEKYIFPNEAMTFSKWWRDSSSNVEEFKKEKLDYGTDLQSSTLIELQKKLSDGNKCGVKPVPYNNLCVGVNKDALCGIFFQPRSGGDSRADRKEYYEMAFKTVEKKQLIKDKLGVELPILFINADSGLCEEEYTEERYRKDIEKYNEEFIDIPDRMERGLNLLEKIQILLRYSSFTSEAPEEVINKIIKIHDELMRATENLDYLDEFSAEILSSGYLEYAQINIENAIIEINNQFLNQIAKIHQSLDEKNYAMEKKLLHSFWIKAGLKLTSTPYLVLKTWFVELNRTTNLGSICLDFLKSCKIDTSLIGTFFNRNNYSAYDLFVKYIGGEEKLKDLAANTKVSAPKIRQRQGK